jgi:Rieske Fe-S protein
MQNRLTRRGFLDKTVSMGAVGVAAAGLCVCMLSGCIGKDRTPSIPDNCIEVKEDRLVVHLDRVEVLRRVGQAAKLKHPRGKTPIIVVHAAEANFIALSALCTHRSRALEYHPKTRELRCINFGHSRFGLDGIVITGPAKTALRVFRTLLIDGKLEVFV